MTIAKIESYEETVLSIQSMMTARYEERMLAFQVELETRYEEKTRVFQAETVACYEERIRVLESELNIYKKRCDQYAQAYELLQQQYKELQRHRFGKKSERFIDDKTLDLSDSKEADDSQKEQEEQSTDEKITVGTYQRRKKLKTGKIIPRRIEIIPVSDEQRICACGCEKTVIRHETKDILHHQPAIFEIVEQRREVVACPNGCDGAIVTAAAPLQILPKAKASEELLSFLIVSKLDDRQPLYHLEKQLSERYGINCSRQTMARWLIDLMLPLQPVFNLMKDPLIEYDVSSCDATTLQVLQEPGRAAETKSYVYCMRGGSPDKQVIFYDYNDKGHKKFVKDWYEGYQGYLHVDGDNFFELIGELETVDLVNCNAHARRKFEPIAKSTKGKGLAKEALQYYKLLYKIERTAKVEQLTPEARYDLRQRESKPLLEKFKQWLDDAWPTVLPESPLGKAINYCLKRWPGLTRYLDDGRLEIDNNLTEQEIKPLVIARKNFLFCASVDGAKALCMHFSFIRTAKLHGLEPYHYYVKLLKSIPHCTSIEDYEKLLPWNITLDG